MCVHYVLLGYCLMVLVNWVGRISEQLDRTLNTPFLVTFLKTLLAVCVCVCVCVWPFTCCSPPYSEDFVVLGSGIMDDAEFDLPAAVLRRVRVWVCAAVPTY